MNILTFISDIVSSLAWPVTTIVLVALLRRPIVDLIPLLKKLKYKELELEFSQEISELKYEVETIAKEKGEKVSLVTADSEPLLDLVSYSTRAAIMESWIAVESAAVETAASFWGVPSGESFKNIPQLGEYLLQCKAIDEKQLVVFNKLKQLRNKAAHAQDLNLSEKDAKSYVQLASELAGYIRKV